MSAAATLDFVLAAVADALRPPPQLTVTEWADASRILPRETTSEAGAWHTSRVPFAREIMDSLSSLDPVEFVSVMKGAQIAGTEIGLNWIGYSIEHDPSPFLLVVPTDGFAKKYSKRRIRPMIESSPGLRARVSPARARDAGNTLLQKEYPGGALVIASAESASSLASEPIRRVMFDEVDRYPHDVDGEGSPLALAEARTTTFSNRKIYAASTPGQRETSYIEPMFLQGDRRRFFVPCPHCQRMDFITWQGRDPFKCDDTEHYRITWPDGSPELAVMTCPGCGCDIEEFEKTAMLAAGQWRATAVGEASTRSYHLPGMYSPLGWLSWGRMAGEFVRATVQAKRGNFLPLQAFINLRLGETWEEVGEKIEKDAILKRAENWQLPAPAGSGAPVPAGVGVLVAAVDVQGDRLEAQVIGYGAAEESWVIDHRQFHGSPEEETVWFELDAYLLKLWRHASGRALPIECVTIDSGGHHSEQVYSFCKPRAERRVYAIRGGTEMGKPLVAKPTRNNKYKALLFTLCVDSGKDRVYTRLKFTKPGPGFMHFPVAPWFDEEYLAQLTAEKKIRKFMPGRGSVPAWKKLRDRNEALDLTVYCLAALYILGQDVRETLGAKADLWAQALAEGEAPTSPAAPPASATPAPAHVPGGFSVTGGAPWVTGGFKVR